MTASIVSKAVAPYTLALSHCQKRSIGLYSGEYGARCSKWRRALEPEKRQAISADMQRRLADQLVWVNLTTYPYFEAYRQRVKNFPFYNQAYQFFDTTWLEQ